MRLALKRSGGSIYIQVKLYPTITADKVQRLDCDSIHVDVIMEVCCVVAQSILNNLKKVYTE